MMALRPAFDPLAAIWYRPYTRSFQPFSVQARDGVNVAGVLLASGHDRLFIYCHGFLGGKNYGPVPRFVEMLGEEADAIAFDFRGHGESEGLCTLGEQEVLDLEAVVCHARELGYRRIVLVGSSMGGATVLQYGARDKDIAGVVTIGAFAHPGFTGLSELGLILARYRIGRGLARIARRCTIWPDLHLPSPLSAVHYISPRPLLMFHGQFDPLIPVSQARELYAAALEPKELVVIPHGDHDIPNLRRWTRDWIMDWLRRNKI